MPTSVATLNKVNSASGGIIPKSDSPIEYSIYVGDLGREVTDDVLFSVFQKYPSCKAAQVVVDSSSGVSKGFGFVRFGDEGEQQRAMSEMNGQLCGTRPMRTSTALPKARTHSPTPLVPPPASVYPQSTSHHVVPMMYPATGQLYPPAPPSQVYNSASDPANSKVFVGGLASHVTEDELRALFEPYGEITSVKIPPNKGCGFVHYVHRQSAETSMSSLQGFSLGGQQIRLSWARSTLERQQIKLAQSLLQQQQQQQQQQHHHQQQQQQQQHVSQQAYQMPYYRQPMMQDSVPYGYAPYTVMQPMEYFDAYEMDASRMSMWHRMQQQQQPQIASPPTSWRMMQPPMAPMNMVA